MPRRPLWVRLLRLVLIVLAILFAALVTAMVLGVSLNLERARKPLSELAGKALGREVSLDGPIRLTVGLVPAVEIGGVRIANPPDFKGRYFAELGRARLKAEVLPLLTGRLVVRDIEITGVALHLQELADGRANWVFTAKGGTTPPPKAKPARQANATGPGNPPPDLDVRKILLKDIRADFTSLMSGAKADFRINECVGQGRSGEPIRLDFKGSAQGRPYVFTVRAVSLAEIFNDDTAWLEFELNMARTTFAFAGEVRLPVSHPWLDVRAGVSGGNMTDLGELLGVDLPPLGPYHANCTLSLRQRLADLRGLNVGVGSSRLTGRASLNKRGPKPVVRVALASPSIQLDDFNVGNWTASGPAENGNATARNGTAEAPDNATKNAATPLLSSEFLRSFDASLGVAVDQVSWGEEKLGKGSLNATLDSGTITVDPIYLEVPGGSMNLNASLLPGENSVNASLNVQVHRFDFGILARHAKPGTDMGGLFSLDMDVRSKAPDPEHIMAHADGKLAVWAQPRNFKAGIMDLWAVNLFSAVMPQLEGDTPSVINCVVADFTIEDGLMTPDKLVVDTSQIRIRGQGQVDFKTRTLDLNLAPTAKRPQFFSLATPVAIHGSMDHFGIGVDITDILGTVVKFVASPITVPFERLFTKDLPTDGGDVCR